MYKGKHNSGETNVRSGQKKRRRLRWRREFVLLVCIAALILSAVGGTVAFLVANGGTKTNTFTYGEVTCSINETFKTGDFVKEHVTVTNTGNTDAFIRAAIVVTWVDKDGYIYPAQPALGTDYSLATGEDWAIYDGYYYYNSSVAAKATTGDLIVSCEPVPGRAPEGYTLRVEILADAIQATGMGADVDTAQEAWAAAAVNG